MSGALEVERVYNNRKCFKRQWIRLTKSGLRYADLDGVQQKPEVIRLCDMVIWLRMMFKNSDTKKLETGILDIKVHRG